MGNYKQNKMRKQGFETQKDGAVTTQGNWWIRFQVWIGHLSPCCHANEVGGIDACQECSNRARILLEADLKKKLRK